MSSFSVNSFFGILIIIFLVLFFLVGLFSFLFLARLLSLTIRRKKAEAGLAMDAMGPPFQPSAPSQHSFLPLPTYSEAVTGSPPLYADIVTDTHS